MKFGFRDVVFVARAQRPAAASGGNTPPMTNLIGWWKADIIAGSNGSSISQWNDSSGLGNNLTQGTGANQPTLATNVINSLPAVRFDSQWFNVPSMLSGLTAAEVFGIIKTDLDPPVDGNLTGLWNWGGTGERTHYTWVDGVIYDNFMSNPRKTTVNPTPSLATWRCYNVSSSQGSNNWTSRLDGTVIFGPTSDGFVNSGASFVGVSFAGGGSNYFLKGWIAEILFYSAVLSSGTRSQVSTYFNTKYGLSIA